MPYGVRRTLIDGQIPGQDGDWCRVSLHASAYQLDRSRDPIADDGESPNANGEDAGTESNGG